MYGNQLSLLTRHGRTVCAMHYTSMTAPTFICTTPNPQAFPIGPLLITSLQIHVMVEIVDFGAALVILID